MTDIIEKLRLVDPHQVVLMAPPLDTAYLQVGLIYRELANEIERLRAENKRLRFEAQRAIERADELRRLLAEIERLGEELERQQQIAKQWQQDAWRYRFLFRDDVDTMCRDPLWPVVDWMRETRIVTKPEIDAAIDQELEKEAKR